MKKLVAKLFIALLVLSGIPSLTTAKTSALEEAVTNNIVANACCVFRVNAYSYQTHSIYLYQGYVSIVLDGDGDTDLDLYVYDSTGLIGKSEYYGDKEVINLTINRADYFTIKVVNRGKVYNDYSLTVQ